MRISWFVERMPRPLALAANLVAMLASAAMFALLVGLGARLVWDEYRFEVLSPGLGEPQWIYTLTLPVFAVSHEYIVLALLIAILIVIGMFLDGVSTFLILLPLLMPIADRYGWDPVWFVILITLKVAIGQFTPPMAVNLMVSCRVAGIPMEATLRWVFPLIGAMLTVLILVVVSPELALWLPRHLGYLR